MTNLLNAELLCHSVKSDDTLTPEELAARAKANGGELWALTDHDELGGQHRAMTAAKAVGLGFDPDQPALLQGLHQTRGGLDLCEAKALPRP